MSKALYNGYELPALPEWDTTAYPYAYIWFPYNSPIEFWLVLIPAEAELVYNSDLHFLFSASHYLRYHAQALDNDWGSAERVEIESGIGISIWKPESVDADEYFTTCWANFDIYSESGQLLLAASEPVPIKEGFDLKSWLTGFALGLSGKPLPLNTGRKLVGYSYNGTVLPKLPEWDKETYPVASISVSGPNISNKGYIALLRIYGQIDAGTAGVSNYFYSSVGGLQYRIEWADGTEAPTDSWGEATVYEAGNDANSGLSTAFDFIVWTNTDIVASDGSWSMTASEPVPVYE